MVINVKKTFCAFRALCALKPTCQRSCRKDTTKKMPLSVYVHFCPFLSVYAQKLFGNLKKNPYLCTVKQHNDDNGAAPSSRIHFAFKDKPLAPSSARAPRRKPSPGRDRREQPLELFEPLLTPPLCGQYKITLSLHFH